MPRPIHIAIASTTSKPGQVAANLEQIRHFARQAQTDHADLLLTPEMSTCGYGGYPEVLATAEVAGAGPIFEALARIARETNVVLLAGFVNAAGSKKHIAHYVIWPDGKWIVQNKHRATPAEQPLDPFARLGPPYGADGCGQPCEMSEVKFETFKVCNVTCALTICADGGVTDRSGMLVRAGVELWLLAAGAGGRREDRVTTVEMLTQAGRQKYAEIFESVYFPKWGIVDCLENRRAHAAVNMCGYDGQNQYHVSHGCIITPMGEIAAILPGQPNLDRQRPTYAHAIVDVADTLPR